VCGPFVHTCAPSNAHKWLFTPKAAACLWTADRNIDDYRPQPTVVSSENDVFAKTDYLTRFMYTGTKDFSSYIAIVDAIKWREGVGGEKAIMEYVGASEASISLLLALALFPLGTSFYSRALALFSHHLRSRLFTETRARFAGTTSGWRGKRGTFW